MPWTHILMALVTGPCAGSWGAYEKALCSTSGYTIRVAQDLLLAQSGTTNSVREPG